MALIAIGIVLSSLSVVLSSVMPISADVPWPTPPPGPRPSVPRVIGDADIKRVQVPLVTGAIPWVIHPISMPVPRFPPVPGFPFRSPDGVRLVSDAGSLLNTVQLIYEPIPITDAQAPGPQQQVRKGFDLRAYDHKTNPIALDLRRPWLLEVPTLGLTNSFEDPARLLIARYDDGWGWVPLVTHPQRDRGTLQARVLKVGRFGVLFEPRAVSG